MASLELHLDAADLERLAELVAERLADRLDAKRSPWLAAPEAADYLRCSLGRLRNLTMLDAVPVHRDGGRVLYRRDELDRFIADGGASTGR